jgi:hypothetical protein
MRFNHDLIVFKTNKGCQICPLDTTNLTTQRLKQKERQLFSYQQGSGIKLTLVVMTSIDILTK